METSGNGITTTLDDILAKGVELKASDIHLEPREEYTRVRYRVDGMLQDGAPIHKSKHQGLISRDRKSVV